MKAAEVDCPDLADDDPQAVKLMVDYLYLGNYNPATLPKTSAIPSVENGVGVEVTQTDPPAKILGVLMMFQQCPALVPITLHLNRMITMPFGKALTFQGRKS